MQTSVINGIPMYQQEDAIDRTSQDKAQIGAIDSRVVSRFATAAAANSAYGAFTAQGGVLTDGMMRMIGGFPEVYRGGLWRGVMPTTRVINSFFETTQTGPAETGVATLAIPDIGHPVFVDCSGVVTIAANTGCQVNTQLKLDATSGQIASAVLNRSGQFPNGEPVSLTFSPYRIGPISGAHNLLCTVARVAGTGNWFVSAAGNYLRADLIPA